MGSLMQFNAENARKQDLINDIETLTEKLAAASKINAKLSSMARRLEIEQAKVAALESEVKDLKAQRKSSSSLLSYYRKKLGVKRRRSAKTAIFEFMSAGLSNAEIVGKGFHRNTVYKARKDYDEMTQCKKD